MRRVLLPHHFSTRAAPAGAAIHDFHGLSMGTSWSVRLAAPAACAHWQAGLQAELDQVVAQMSHWRADSELGRFNRAPGGSWHSLSPGFFEVLGFALGVAADSGGACDPCAGALVNLWGFGPGRRYDEPGFAAPTPYAVAALLAAQRGRRVELDPALRRARQPGGVLLDLSAVAKGYGVDCLARYLEGQGVHDYLAEVGGELRGAGVKPDGQPWWVGLEQADVEHGSGQIALALHGLAVATSGDYRRYFMQGTTRQAHTIDTRSGMPVAHALASVTVLHPSCMAADAWSTALTVLGPQAGLALAERQGLAARFVLREDGGFGERMSSHFAAMLAA